MAISSHSVLVVHKSDEVCSFLKGLFEEEGYSVYSENDGVSALRSIIEKKPRLIFVGEELPALSGSDIISIIKSDKSDYIICLIGGDGKRSDYSAHLPDASFALPLEISHIKRTIDTIILERRLKEEAELKKREPLQTKAFLASLLEHIGVAVITLNHSRKILSFNKKAQKLWGYQSNFVIGRDFDILCIGENRDKCAPIFVDETIREGSYEGALYFERADGTRFPGRLQTSLIKGEEGEEGIVVVVRDLTKQRELEDKLLEKEKFATLGMVVEGVAHEVRNPLISIGGFARRILKKVKPDFPYKNYLKVIVEDVSRLETMIKDIESYVHFTKLHKPNFKRGHIENILDTTMELLDKRKLKDIKVVTEYDPTIPVLFLDVGYVVEMFFNLVENAIEAMPDGGTLTIKALRDGHSWCIVKITDTGCGIPDDKIGEIFNLFYTTKMSGVGLGLAKAHIIADEHGGKIDIESVPGRGTVVTVMLPLERRQKARR